LKKSHERNQTRPNHQQLESQSFIICFNQYKLEFIFITFNPTTPVHLLQPPTPSLTSCVFCNSLISLISLIRYVVVVVVCTSVADLWDDRDYYAGARAFVENTLGFAMREDGNTSSTECSMPTSVCQIMIIRIASCALPCFMLVS
jgi:hypothetical protein